MSICKDCFHSYVCEEFNEHRECDNKKCHFANDHFVPAEDVVKVVRCEKCKHCDLFYPCKAIDEDELKPEYYCNMFKQYRKPTDYCSCGELEEREKV